jgi:hypothetical protein
MAWWWDLIPNNMMNQGDCAEDVVVSGVSLDCVVPEVLSVMVFVW